MMRFVFHRIENMVEKGDMLINCIFSFSHIVLYRSKLLNLQRNLSEMMVIVCRSVENFEGKRRNAGY